MTSKVRKKHMNYLHNYTHWTEKDNPLNTFACSFPSVPLNCLVVNIVQFDNIAYVLNTQML